jgi:hypothetical protein
VTQLPGARPHDIRAHAMLRANGLAMRGTVAVEYPWRVKNQQARAHIGRFNTAAEEYVARANLELRYDVDPVAGTVGVRLHSDAEPPLSLGAIMGDVLHNLRSALDSIAWAACQRAGVAVSHEKRIYFPIGTDPGEWPALSKSHLPNLSAEHLEVFRRFQPWYWDEQAGAVGVEMSTAHRHPLARLHELAKMDRHRVTLPILAAEGDTWLGLNEGVSAEILRAGHASPGEVFLEWRINPPSAAADVHRGGDVLLALDDESAGLKRTAVSELNRFHQEVVQATTAVEVDVLGVVTTDDLSGLRVLEHTWHDAETALRALMASTHVIDTNYMDRYRAASEAEQQAKIAYVERWRELFE